MQERAGAEAEGRERAGGGFGGGKFEEGAGVVGFGAVMVEWLGGGVAAGEVVFCYLSVDFEGGRVAKAAGLGGFGGERAWGRGWLVAVGVWVGDAGGKNGIGGFGRETVEVPVGFVVCVEVFVRDGGRICVVFDVWRRRVVVDEGLRAVDKCFS